MRALVVTGTDTGVGKTVVTAALARGYVDSGSRVAVVKPVQTGVLPGEHGDLAEVTRLSGVSAVHEFARLRDPLAPAAAARREGVELPSIDSHAARVTGLAADVVLVEGAGGVLVPLDCAGGTVADLALALAGHRMPVDVVVVAHAGLGTLNHTALTVEALRSRGLRVVGLVIGSWPAEPDLAAVCNLEDLPAVTGAPLLGRVPAGAGGLSPRAFASAVPMWFPDLP